MLAYVGHRIGYLCTCTQLGRYVAMAFSRHNHLKYRSGQLSRPVSRPRPRPETFQITKYILRSCSSTCLPPIISSLLFHRSHMYMCRRYITQPPRPRRLPRLGSSMQSYNPPERPTTLDLSTYIIPVFPQGTRVNLNSHLQQPYK